MESNAPSEDTRWDTVAPLLLLGLPILPLFLTACGADFTTTATVTSIAGVVALIAVLAAPPRRRRDEAQR